MIYLVTGGSGSGKSAYAESLLSGFENIRSRYYIATMQVYGEEGKKRVERHRRLRAGKGFITSEQTVQIEQALKKFKDSDKMSYAALVECVSNLTANEMFDENGQRSEDEVVRRVVSGLKVLSQSVRELVIVTNNVFDDGKPQARSADAAAAAFVHPVKPFKNAALAFRRDANAGV